MTEPITIEQLKNASLDAKTLEQVINGDDNTDVTSRLGATYPTLDKALKVMMEKSLIDAKPFLTYEMMQSSNLAVDQHAVVTNDPDINLNGIWLKSNTGFTKVALQPATNMRTSPDYTYAYAITDAEYNVGLGITHDADVVFAGVVTSQSDDVGFSYAVLDQNGNAALLIDKNGKVIINDLQILSQNKSTNPAKITVPKTDYIQIMGYGQSLSRGVWSLPAVTTSQPYNNVMLKSGVLARYDQTHDWSEFVPLVESVNPNDIYEGETYISTIANEYVLHRQAQGDDSTYCFVGASQGRGGRTIEELSHSGEIYNNMIKNIQASYDVAQKNAKSYSVWALAWAQGEANILRESSDTSYTEKLIALKNNFINDVKNITKQDTAPVFLTYQTTDANPERPNYVQIGQLNAHITDDDIVLATPIYFMPRTADDLHISADASIWLGRYFEKALHKWSIGTKHEPLRPKSLTWSGRVIDITYYTDAELTFDTSVVPMQPNYGFDIWVGGQLVNDAIASVEIADKDRIRIVLNATYSDDAVLTYARGRAGQSIKPCGNIRDNAGDADFYADSKGVVRHMHNWSVIFNHKYGE